MKTKNILIIVPMLLLTLACSMADLNAAGAALRNAALASSSPTGTPLSQKVTAPVPTVDSSVPENGQPVSTHTVCTGVPEGQLRVRSAASTNSAVVAVLTEGTEVTVLEADETSDTWLEIADPAGFVNARYLCEKN